MIEIKFKDCCQVCKDRDTYLNENVLSGFSERMAVTTEIGCKHESVCKEYREEGVKTDERYKTTNQKMA